MLRLGHQNSWEIFLTVYKRFSECWSSQSTLPPKGETITFMAGECLAWLACGVKSVSRFRPSIGYTEKPEGAHGQK